MSLFHSGERAVQERAGVAAMANRVGASIRDFWPIPAREFVAQQQFAAVATQAAGGEIWASILTGETGFLSAPNEKTLVLALNKCFGPSASDPFWANSARPNAPLGLIALDAATRRRLRANGHVQNSNGAQLQISSDQVYSNCPKYIQQRRLLPFDSALWNGAPRATGSDFLDEPARDLVARADTFFIATAAAQGGADCSHRGGFAGFVRIENDARTLVFEDYSGNAMFNTLGNIESNPRAGLAFLDYENGDVLQISGAARIEWNGEARRVIFETRRALWTPNATPLRWSFESYSPFNPAL